MARPTAHQRKIKQAKELLENETLKSIFDDRKEELRDQWQAGQTVEKREACFSEITALEGLRDAIYAIATDIG